MKYFKCTHVYNQLKDAQLLAADAAWRAVFNRQTHLPYCWEWFLSQPSTKEPSCTFTWSSDRFKWMLTCNFEKHFQVTGILICSGPKHMVKLSTESHPHTGSAQANLYKHLSVNSEFFSFWSESVVRVSRTLTGQRRETLKLVVAISLSGSAVSFSLTVIWKKKMSTS